MSISNHSNHIVRLYFAPSILSGFLSILFGLVLLSLSFYFLVIKKSQFSGYYEEVFVISSETSKQLDQIRFALENSVFIADSAVFMFWVAVGTLIYIIGEILYKYYSGGKEFVDEMSHTQPKSRLWLLGIGLQHIFLRLLGIFGVFVLYKILIMLLPLAVLNVYRLISIDEIWTVLLLLVAAFLLGILVIHWLTLCLRLITYRLRVIGSIDS